MRKIKFRGKPIEDYGTVKWFYGNLLMSYEDKLAYIEADGQGTIPVECHSVGQFTGIYDANDNEIYEGDLVEDFIHKVRYEVVWDDYGMFLFNPIETEGQALDYYEFEETVSTVATIVVGNITENPELLTA